MDSPLRTHSDRQYLDDDPIDEDDDFHLPHHISQDLGYDLSPSYIHHAAQFSDEESLPDSGLCDTNPQDSFLLDTEPMHISHHQQSSQQKPPMTEYKLKYALRGHTHAVSQVRLSPDGRWIASSAADATIKVWNAQTGQLTQTLEGHLAGISAFAWSPDSATIASGADDKIIRMWDRATGKAHPNALKGHSHYVFSISFSPKGNMLASGSYDESVFLWDVRTGKQMMSLPAHSDPVGGVDFNRDGTLIASCATDGLM